MCLFDIVPVYILHTTIFKTLAEEYYNGLGVANMSHRQDIVELFANLTTYIDTEYYPCIKAFSFSIGLQCLYHSSFPTVNVSSAS